MNRLIRVARVMQLVTIVSIAAAACGGRTDGSVSPTPGDGALSVVASFYPLAFAAERVGGESVTVETLTPPGVEPHDLELTPDDLQAIAEADVVVYLRGGFQPAVEEAVDAEALGVTVDALDGLELLPAVGTDGSRAVDPHVWLDPVRFADVVDRIGLAFGEAKPSDATAFRANADALRDELSALDDEFRRGLADCRTRLMITNHVSFAYLADAYDLEQQAISGVAPESEPDPAHIAELAELARAEGVRVIFTEDLLSAEVAETLAQEAGVGTAVLNPLEGLTQPQAAAGDDYVSVMRRNLEALRDGLTCT